MLFPNLHIERWAFDVELVYLATRKGIPMMVRRLPLSFAANFQCPFHIL